MLRRDATRFLFLFLVLHYSFLFGSMQKIKLAIGQLLRARKYMLRSFQVVNSCSRVHDR